MNIITLLKRDHKEMKSVMNELAKAAESKSKRQEKLFDTFKELYHAHDQKEDGVLYPFLMQEPKLKPLTLKAYAAHHMAEVGIAELRLLPFASESWGPTFLVVRDSILMHIEEEETVLFKKMQSLFFDTDLKELGKQAQEKAAEPVEE